MEAQDSTAVHQVSLQSKIRALKDSDSYPDSVVVSEIRWKETHMAWVALTDHHAWKMKKPTRTRSLDFSTLEARREDCRQELRLNRRLAPDVYLDVVPLARNENGDLRLEDEGTVVEWVVKMRRLAEDRMLDARIRRGETRREEVDRLAELLSGFYTGAEPEPVTPEAYRSKLRRSLEECHDELLRPVFAMERDRVVPLIRKLLDFVQRKPELFDHRVLAGRVVEAHGDLRPEHVCLEDPPVVIDCLEFDRSLRILDAASDLSFLALECERLGSPWVGERIFEQYEERTGDRIPGSLLAFYRAQHCCLRAQVALWHLDDEEAEDREHWRTRAEEYLEAAHG
ncbi:MAG: hypothetical protein R3234_04160 [Thermoanaerobaculia bacterium]|nr:hypothetical protein [Thermoanaerobaculia bacterium]